MPPGYLIVGQQYAPKGEREISVPFKWFGTVMKKQSFCNPLNTTILSQQYILNCISYCL